jgi:hypothetical protein
MEFIPFSHLFIERQPEINLKKSSHEIQKQHQKARNPGRYSL